MFDISTFYRSSKRLFEISRINVYIIKMLNLISITSVLKNLLHKKDIHYVINSFATISLCSVLSVTCVSLIGVESNSFELVNS